MIHHVLVLADIHANEMALQAVLEDAFARYQPPLEVWFLGDLFGRGPDPLAIWRQLNTLAPKVIVVGNHDWGVIGKHQDVKTAQGWDGPFNPQDWEIILRHRMKLLESGLIQFDAKARPIGGSVVNQINTWSIIASPYPGIYAMHGGCDLGTRALQDRVTETTQPLAEFLADTIVWTYVKNAQNAQATIELLEWLLTQEQLANWIITGEKRIAPQIVLIGHWHKRVLFRKGHALSWESPVVLDRPYQIDRHAGQVLLSPGSVGFPREPASRAASYAVLEMHDSEVKAVTFHAREYPRALVRERMKQHNYPAQIINYLVEPAEAMRD